MNKLQYLFIHCSASRGNSRPGAERIRQMHMSPPSQGGRGWDRPGYRTVIEKDGKTVRLRDANYDAWVQPGEVTWGVGPSFNGISHHICWDGGLSNDGKRAEDNRTEAQKKTLEEIVNYYIRMVPDIIILGHNQVANKACPSFWVPSWLRSIGVNEKHIDSRDPFGYSRMKF